MTTKRILQVGLSGLFLFILGAIIYMSIQAYSGPELVQQDDEAQPDREPREPITSPRTDGELDPESGDVIAGGVERPATDVSEDSAGSDGLASEKADDDWSYGQTPPVKPDANGQVAAVHKAIENRKADPRTYAKATSSLAESDAFDQAKYQSDTDYRESYLNNPQPSRVFQTAQPGPNVPRLHRISSPLQEVVQGKRLPLRVRAIPGAPVTFTSFDLGRFDNELTSVTVEADARGYAEVDFRGIPGTIDDINILAASPMTSGQVRLTVHVTRPE